MLAVCLLTAWLAPSGTRAQSPLVLELEPGITCLQRASLEESLFKLLTDAQQTSDLTVQVQGSLHDPRSAVITLARDREAIAQRSFSPGPPHCTDFHQAVALVISLMIKSLEEIPISVAQAPEPPPLPAPPPQDLAPRATVRPVRLVSRPAPLPTKRAQPLVLSALASGALGKHVGARTAWGTRLELSLSRSHYGVRLGLLALFARADRLAETEVEYVTRPLAASLSGCVGSPVDRGLGLRGCVGLLAGRIRNRGLSAEDVQALSATLPWVALTVALELSLPLHDRLRLLLSVAPSYTTRELRVGALGADKPSEALPRLGALLTIGVAYDVYRQGSPGYAHE